MSDPQLDVYRDQAMILVDRRRSRAHTSVDALAASVFVLDGDTGAAKDLKESCLHARLHIDEIWEDARGGVDELHSQALCGRPGAADKLRKAAQASDEGNSEP